MSSKKDKCNSFAKKINRDVLAATGFDLPELSGNAHFSRSEVLEALRHAKRWHDDFAQQCQSQIDDIIIANFSDDERLVDY